MKPEYGASNHMAKVLLAMMSHDPSSRASMNVRYDQRMRRALWKMKLKPILLEDSEVKSESEMIGSLNSALRRAAGPVAAVVDPGAPGLEPGLYLFAHDAERVVQLGLRIARTYAAEP